MSRRKIQFNVIDLLIIILVLIAAAVLVKTYIADDTASDPKNKVSLQYVIQSDMIAESLSDNVEPGDTVYDKKTGRVIGKVLECDVRNAVYTGISDSGVQTVSDIAGYKVLYITVQTTAERNPGVYSVENIPISAGNKCEVMFKNLYCTGSFISVEVTG